MQYAEVTLTVAYNCDEPVSKIISDHLFETLSEVVVLESEEAGLFLLDEQGVADVFYSVVEKKIARKQAMKNYEMPDND